MSKKIVIILASIIIAGIVLLVIPQFFNGEKIENQNINKSEIINELYQNYRNGSISECRYDDNKEDKKEGELYYSAGINTNDAGRVIFNKKGKKVAECNYFTNKIDRLCNMLEKCEVVYAVEDNIWGYGAINRYGLK